MGGVGGLQVHGKWLKISLLVIWNAAWGDLTGSNQNEKDWDPLSLRRV